MVGSTLIGQRHIPNLQTLSSQGLRDIKCKPSLQWLLRVVRVQVVELLLADLICSQRHAELQVRWPLPLSAL
jgi:hypothetical protein